MAIKKITLQNENGERIREIAPIDVLHELDPGRTYELSWTNRERGRLIGDIDGLDISDIQSAVAGMFKVRDFNNVRDVKMNDYYLFIRESGYVAEKGQRKVS